mgnify:CR=1 FL=1
MMKVAINPAKAATFAGAFSRIESVAGKNLINSPALKPLDALRQPSQRATRVGAINTPSRIGSPTSLTTKLTNPVKNTNFGNPVKIRPGFPKKTISTTIS